MKKLIIIAMLLAVGSVYAVLQCYEVNVTNAYPTSATIAANRGMLSFVAKGKNMKVYSQLVDVTLGTPSSMTNAAQIAVSNFAGYVISEYGKFATTTAQEYLGAFKVGEPVLLLLRTTNAATAGSTGTNALQKVYIYVW